MKQSLRIYPHPTGADYLGPGYPFKVFDREPPRPEGYRAVYGPASFLECARYVAEHSPADLTEEAIAALNAESGPTFMGEPVLPRECATAESKPYTRQELWDLLANAPDSKQAMTPAEVAAVDEVVNALADSSPLMSAAVRGYRPDLPISVEDARSIESYYLALVKEQGLTSLFQQEFELGEPVRGVYKFRYPQLQQILKSPTGRRVKFDPALHELPKPRIGRPSVLGAPYGGKMPKAKAEELLADFHKAYPDFGAAWTKAAEALMAYPTPAKDLVCVVGPAGQPLPCGGGATSPLRWPLNSLEATVLAWWRNHRPVYWGSREHLDNPAINCNSEEDKALAAQAALVFLNAVARGDLNHERALEDSKHD